MKFRLLDLVLAAMADPGRSPAETLAFLTRRAALQARRDLAGKELAGNDSAGNDSSGSPVEDEHDECAGFELGFAAALGTSEHGTAEHDTPEDE